MKLTKEEVLAKYKKYQKEWASRPESKLWKKNYMDKYRKLPERIKYERKYQKERRHRLGINKKYNHNLRKKVNGIFISKTKEYRRLHRQKYKALKKKGGELSIQTIQLIYEDNIKQYGTLTCYLCLKPIPFGKDHLEHKTPLSRGGTNSYNNLAIACQHCNNKKYYKTEEEFRKEI